MPIETHKGMLDFWRAKTSAYGYKVEIKFHEDRDEDDGLGNVFLNHDKYGSTEIPYDLAPSGADIRRLEAQAKMILQTRDPSSWKTDTLGG